MSIVYVYVLSTLFYNGATWKKNLSEWPPCIDICEIKKIQNMLQITKIVPACVPITQALPWKTILLYRCTTIHH